MNDGPHWEHEEPEGPPPLCNIEGEQAVLGAMLLNNESFWNVDGWLRQEHFYDLLHGRIFDAIAQLVRAGTVADGVTLKSRFETDPALLEIGGTGYFGKLANASLGSPVAYAKSIVGLAQRRHLAEVSRQLAEFSEDRDLGAEEMIEQAEQAMAEVADDSRSQERVSTISEAVSAAIEEALVAAKSDGGITGARTGLNRIDNVTAGAQPGELHIMAGRPAMGKTALAAVAARGASLDMTREKQGVLFFSQEMSSVQFARRTLSEELFNHDIELPYENIKKGMLKAGHLEVARRVAEELREMPLLVEDIGNRTVAQIAAISRAADRRFRQSGHGGLGAIFIDHLQLIVGGSKNDYNRTSELTKITRDLKALAKRMELPVIALSQLSRQVENRDDKRPLLSDLRESGSIEQDADVVMFLYRPVYYLERHEPDPDSSKHLGWLADCAAEKDRLYVNFAKVREGRTQTVRLFTRIDLNVIRDDDPMDMQGGFALGEGML